MSIPLLGGFSRQRRLTCPAGWPSRRLRPGLAHDPQAAGRQPAQGPHAGALPQPPRSSHPAHPSALKHGVAADDAIPAAEWALWSNHSTLCRPAANSDSASTLTPGSWSGSCWSSTTETRWPYTRCPRASSTGNYFPSPQGPAWVVRRHTQDSWLLTAGNHPFRAATPAPRGGRWGPDRCISAPVVRGVS